MNQALAFGLLLAGGVMLEAGLTGAGLGAVVQGRAGSVPNQGSEVGAVTGAGVAGAGAKIAAGISSIANKAAGVIDPIPGYTIGRTDMGVDATAAAGTPIVAPAASELVGVISDWYAGQPLLLFRFLQRPAGAPSDYWYAAEQLAPVSTRPGTTFEQGETVATYAPSGTGIEIGWGDPSASSRTLAGAQGNSWEANPPAGQSTPAGSSFERFFGIGA